MGRKLNLSPSTSSISVSYIRNAILISFPLLTLTTPFTRCHSLLLFSFYAAHHAHSYFMGSSWSSIQPSNNCPTNRPFRQLVDSPYPYRDQNRSNRSCYNCLQFVYIPLKCFHRLRRLLPSSAPTLQCRIIWRHSPVPLYRSTFITWNRQNRDVLFVLRGMLC